MAENESGWTKEDPKVDGVYWWRSDRTDFEPDIHYVSNGKFYEVGEQFSRVVEGFGGEWLGPISPTDFEQLTRLREAATVALKWMDWWLDSELCECDGYGHVCGKPERKREADQLREALAQGHTGGEKS